MTLQFHSHSSRRFSPLLKLLGVVVSTLLLWLPTYAQGSAGTAPPNASQGSPAGAFKLSGLENVSPFSGNMNFTLPLLQLGGRGDARVPVNLSIDSVRWEMKREGGGNTNSNGQTAQQAGNYPGIVITVIETNTTNVTSYNCREDSCTNYQYHSYSNTYGLTIDGTMITDAPNNSMPDPTYYTFDPDGWQNVRAGYGPGVLQAITISHSGPHNGGRKIITRLTFKSSDGTEYELIDQQSDGAPWTNTTYEQTHSRGTVFVSKDGQSVIFVSDNPIMESFSSEPQPTIQNPYGYLLFSDGTRFRVENGLIVWQRDRNGNQVSFVYGTDPDDTATYRQVLSITDSLGREVTITYHNPDPHPVQSASAPLFYDEITYKSVGETSRTLRIWRTNLIEALREGYEIETYADLFLAYEQDSTGSTIYNPPDVATAVDLPDGRRYQFKYNSHNELARVILPTGGKIEYDYIFSSSSVNVQRRLKERRVYQNSSDTTPELKQVYDVAYAGTPSSQPYTTNITMDQRGSDDQLLSKEKHTYYGNANALHQGLYVPWREGREMKAEFYAADGTTPLRRVEYTWKQRALFQWYTSTSDPAQNNAPMNDPRLVETKTTLLDVTPNLIAKQTTIDPSNPALVGFDQFNNPTDVWEYDYRTESEPEKLLRHTQTVYLLAGPAPTPSPSPSPSASPTPSECNYCGNCRPCVREGDSIGPDAQAYLMQNLVRLPAIVRTFGVNASGQEQIQGRIEYAYDETSLESRNNIIGWTNPNSSARGNVTTTKRWSNPTNETAFITASAKYDIAGNVTEITDSNNRLTQFSYTDCFGTANSNARSGMPPASLVSYTYAFPTSVTNALGQSAYTKYDYYSGLPVTVEDLRGVKTNLFYNDNLDRVTQVVQAAGTALQRQTTFDYLDNEHKVVTTVDLNALNNNKLKSETIYDGLGRTTELHSYENSSSFVTTRRFYDGLGRIIKSTNPYHTESDPTYGAIETTYDALGRVIKLKTTPAPATEVLTQYAGNTVTAIDQAGTRRKNVFDSLGQLTTVFEAPNVSGYNFETRYRYDALGNLIKVIQGPQDTINDQTRTFVYNGLSQMTSSTNPESDTTTYQYDANGNLVEKTDPRLLPGQSVHVKVNYIYDVGNRLTKRSYNDGTPEVNYYYDAQALPTGAPALERGASAGQLIAVTYGGSNSINGSYQGYDIAGRVIKSAQVTDGKIFPTMEYRYDLAGNLTWQKYPSGREITTGYDDEGKLISISGVQAAEGSRTYASLAEYGPHGAITALRLGNGLWERITYNPRLQPTVIKLGTQSNSESVLKLDYSYGTTDNNGDIRSQTITIPASGAIPGFTATQSYEYDQLNRLKVAQETSSTGAQSWKQTYSYDRFGNRRLYYTNGGTTVPTLSQVQSNEAYYNPQISPANDNRLVGYVYDAAGNVTTDAQSRTFGYDYENRQISYNGGASINSEDTASYFYDGDGRRIKKQVGGTMSSTIFVYNAMGQLVAEYTDSQAQRPAQTSYVAADTLGSTRVVTGQDQSVKERHDYLPFGEDIGAQWGRTGDQQFAVSAMRQRFAGYEKDTESQMDFGKARYYANRAGRFTSPDPLLASGRAPIPQSWNRYIYCINNPLNFSDPLGLDWGIIGNMPTFYATVEDRLAAGVRAFRPVDGIYQATNGHWYRVNDNGTVTDVTPMMDRLKMEIINAATGGIYYQVIETKDEITTKWYTVGQDLKEAAFATSNLFDTWGDEHPGDFTDKDMAIGVFSYAYKPEFKGSAIIGTDRSISDKPGTLLLPKIIEKMKEIVASGGTLRVNLRGIELDAVFNTKHEQHDSYTSQELHYIYTHPKMLQNTAFYIFRNGQYERCPTPILNRHIE